MVWGSNLVRQTLYQRSYQLSLQEDLVPLLLSPSLDPLSPGFHSVPCLAVLQIRIAVNSEIYLPISQHESSYPTSKVVSYRYREQAELGVAQGDLDKTLTGLCPLELAQKGRKAGAWAAV